MKRHRAPPSGAAPSRTAPRRGRPKGGTGLTREKVLDAALALVDQEGVDALSMRGLAAVMGVDAMSLYNHVDNKDAVLDGLAERLLASIERPVLTGDWRRDLRALALSFRQVALRHPGIAPLVLTRQLGSLQAMAVSEAALATLDAAGVPPKEAVHVLRFILAFLIGALVREVSSGPTFSGLDLDGLAERHTALKTSGLRHVARAARHLAACDHAAEFEFGVDMMVAALEARLGSSRGPKRRAK
ncbi:TetR/AcrR family transcriptional regulator C-terminal domain-containing protein [Myxococcus landrumensis]|uniref:TetR/AcrR family transcriptional regulator C-terminal domain-containing protein n=1 Tax=Myxococcus landrumensis TaxID=2813577 RepID=A0ABX7NMD0_9BACT|nr:TetR/AcrR family transcriptional regulator C-terminal domain-containing protein [Myxococcus landrumus]QSQ17408.1 TetR/AcrR family transcriptional regulator C-terminal domain-containing protein [Myxococcus landrumus]